MKKKHEMLNKLMTRIISDPIRIQLLPAKDIIQLRH